MVAATSAGNSRPQSRGTQGSSGPARGRRRTAGALDRPEFEAQFHHDRYRLRCVGLRGQRQLDVYRGLCVSPDPGVARPLLHHHRDLASGFMGGAHDLPTHRGPTHRGRLLGHPAVHFAIEELDDLRGAPVRWPSMPAPPSVAGSGDQRASSHAVSPLLTSGAGVSTQPGE